MSSTTVVRTCVGCHEAVDQQELVRVALDRSTDPPSVHWDEDRRRGGRGAWVHPRSDCVERALVRRGFQRSFRGPMDTTAFEEAWRNDEESASGRRPTSDASTPTDEGGSEI